MAGLKGAKVMVAAPNEGTNQLLTSSAMQAMCAEQAAKIQARVYSETARDMDMTTTEKKRRYPIVVKKTVAATFNGTRRSGAIVKGQQWGIRATTVRRAMRGLK